MRALWLGKVDYDQAWLLQRELAALRADGAVSDHLLLLEHPPTITLGRGADESHLLMPRSRLEAEGIAVHDVDRGGDVTYHGPGQLVGYPIFDLAAHKKDLHWFLRQMEEALIRVMDGYGLGSRRFPPHTGVWVGEMKIAAIGIKVSRWVTMHGFALNVTADPADFDCIVPCGIYEYGITSLHREIGKSIPLQVAAGDVAAQFDRMFAISDIRAEAPVGRLSDSSRKILSEALDMHKSGC